MFGIGLRLRCDCLVRPAHIFLLIMGLQVATGRKTAMVGVVGLRTDGEGYT